ncbi:phospholipase A1-Igamma1, chloroplastic-like [Diospyros lotus]|uniref:phospholipase A1-Igamma1, chloroplastic-like n=1 Tax=Diospyros lotus TaxID=55363 RepID=UPI0022540312|nr:phospholipase A1-Igamma1, chloroplastic-like [Diospyros lotus]
MAVSPSNMATIPFKPRHQNHLLLQSQPPLPPFCQKSPLGFSQESHLRRRSRRSSHAILQASSKTSDLSLPSTASLADHLEIEKEKKSDEPRLADCWREIHGEGDWVGMLDPCHPALRSELIRYGEMAQACYDAFDYEPFSKYCGSCRFSRLDFFKLLGMEDAGYEVTRYLYATSNINLPNFFKKSRWPKVWSKNANWIGYVAVSNEETSRRLGRRDIAVAWRGTVTRLEWIADLMDFLKPVSSNKIPCPDPTVKVESGFLDLYTDRNEECRFCKYSAREQILTEIRRLIEMYPDEDLSITMTGHSLGSALAILSGYDIVEAAVNVMGDGRVAPVCVFSYSGPRVGNVRFKERVELLELKVLRVVNVHDVVPKSPGFIFNEAAPPVLMKVARGLPWSYSHVGVELALDHQHSPFLKPAGDLACAHNLEALLHLLDGYHGKGRRFALASGRDPALVNKACDFLKDHYMVPPNWRQDHNKGMIRDPDGRWIQPERPRIEDHPDDMPQHLTQLGFLHNTNP